MSSKWNSPPSDFDGISDESCEERWLIAIAQAAIEDSVIKGTSPIEELAYAEDILPDGYYVGAGMLIDQLKYRHN